jgi:hypothetical protein
MSVRYLFALAVGLALAAPASAQDPPKKADPAETVLERLFMEIQLDDNTNINDIPLFEILQNLSKRYAVTFVINEEAFRGVGIGDIKEAKPRLAATQLRGASLHQFLALTLDSMGAAYLVKGGMIEIVPTAHAAKVTKAALHPQDESGRVTFVEPLVSAVFKEKPLNGAVALLAERYDLNIVVSPQAGDGRVALVTARLLNVPADQALDLLAVQADLRIVRKGNAYLITSREHANELFAEQLKQQRTMIEMKNLRTAPPPKPQPELKPEQ